MNAKELGAMPAQAVRCISQNNSNGGPTSWESYDGLTKREAFAMAAMQGMAMRVTSLLDHEVAGAAVRLADELIEALARQTP